MNARVKIKDRIERLTPLLRDKEGFGGKVGWDFTRGEIHGLLKALDWIDADEVVSVNVLERLLARALSPVGASMGPDEPADWRDDMPPPWAE